MTSITIKEQPVEYYTHRIASGFRFAFAGYSDAEWFCMLRYNIGRRTGAGQILEPEVGNRLLEIIVRRNKDSDFLIAVPSCIWEEGTDFQTARIPQQINDRLSRAGVDAITFYERDMVLDGLAENAGIWPWISQLRKSRVVMIGNANLRRVREEAFDFEHFLEIPPIDFHLHRDGVGRLVEQASEMDIAEGSVFSVSAGVSAAPIIDALYDVYPACCLIDFGSTWDVFCGIGAQRKWRGDLYASPDKLQAWKDRSLGRA